MILDAFSRKIRHSFSDAAAHYDRFSDVHQTIGQGLLKMVSHRKAPHRVLDIGMGTGWLTDRLTSAFPGAVVIGIDIASGMVACARSRGEKFKILQADAACLPFKDRSFDLIVSNLAFQWVPNLPMAFEMCRTRLKPGGMLCLSMFGHNTFHELFMAFEACARKRPVRRLLSEDQIVEAVGAAGFSHYQVRTQSLQGKFSDMIGLIKWIKAIGANALGGNRYVGRDVLSKANAYYHERFRDSDGVYATFEVVWVEAVR